MRFITVHTPAAWLATILLILAPTAQAAGARRPVPDVRSEAVLVIDAADDSVLVARNADVSVPIASITKLMTALVVLEAGLPRDEAISIIAEDRATNVGGPSRIVIGASLTRGELLHLALR